METFAQSQINKVANKMSDFEKKDCFENQNRFESIPNDQLVLSDDLVMEQILDNINTTPIGQVLKKIASLPEVRKEKVLGVRRQLNDGNYDLNERLNIALDKVLEDLTA